MSATTYHRTTIMTKKTPSPNPNFHQTTNINQNKNTIMTKENNNAAVSATPSTEGYIPQFTLDTPIIAWSDTESDAFKLIWIKMGNSLAEKIAPLCAVARDIWNDEADELVDEIEGLLLSLTDGSDDIANLLSLYGWDGSDFRHFAFDLSTRADEIAALMRKAVHLQKIVCDYYNVEAPTGPYGMSDYDQVSIGI